MKPIVRLLPASLRTAVPAVALALAFAPSAWVCAQEENPFARPGPVGVEAPAPPSPLDTLELRGVLTMSGTTVVTLVNTAENNRSFMVPVGSTVGGITVSDYQSEDGSVLVQSGGRERRVKFKKTQIVTMVAPPPVVAPVPQPGAPVVAAAGAPPPAPGAPGAMGDEEVRQRMERVAQEIRRRREMRREIMERQGQGQPAQPQQ